MKVSELKISGLKVIEPNIFLDNRGFFYESFNQRDFNKYVCKNITFVQDNHSKSRRGVIRGLHMQVNTSSQGKLVRVIKGEIYDVAVDCREDSRTKNSWEAVILSDHNKKQFWIPDGFLHGFMVLSDYAEVIYKTTNFYDPENEISVHWKNNNFNILWPKIESEIILSTKDSSN